MSNRITFAGVTFATTSTGRIPLPALLKILRSGRIDLRCSGRYTDDYAWDAQTNFGRGAQDQDATDQLAREIKACSAGWYARLSDGALRLQCHTFLGYDGHPRPDGAPDAPRRAVPAEGDRLAYAGRVWRVTGASRVGPKPWDAVIVRGECTVTGEAAAFDLYQTSAAPDAADDSADPTPRRAPHLALVGAGA